jgi:hypothetical protein
VPPSLPPVIPEERLSTAAAQIGAAALSKVDFHGASDARAPFSAGVAFGHTLYTNTAAIGGGFQEERVDLYLRGLEVGRGLRAYLQATAILWSRRPPSMRFRPDAFTLPLPQLYLWEAELASRDPNRSYTVAFGRIWPWHAPGLTLLDGVQLGWQSKKRPVEVGAYGGLVPNAVDTLPAYQQWAAGVYASASASHGRVLFHEEARAGVRNYPSSGPSIQVESVSQLWVGRRFDLGVDGRVAVAPQVPSSFTLESANLHLGARALDGGRVRLRTYAWFRYLGPVVAEEAALRGERPNLGGALRASVDATLEVGPLFALALDAGGDHDRASALDRLYVAAEARLLRLAHDRVDLAAGYQEELGWVTGRTAYPQIALRILDRLRVCVRASYNEERFTDTDRNQVTRDLGVFASLEARLGRWLELRGSALARVPVTITGNPTPAAPAGVVLNLRLVGTWR